jgi:hypothetical protein
MTSLRILKYEKRGENERQWIFEQGHSPRVEMAQEWAEEEGRAAVKEVDLWPG